MEASDSETIPPGFHKGLDFLALFPPSRARVLTNIRSQKACLRRAAEIFSADCRSLNPRDVLGRLLDRERLGSTAMDHSGIAIPHCRLNSCKNAMGALLRTDSLVDFGDERADIFFVLVVPDCDAENRLYLEILSTIAEVYGEDDLGNAEELRMASSGKELGNVFHRHMAEFLST